MSETTKIAWCDSTVNFWSGCTKVSPGCANCYAEAQGKRFESFGKWGKDAPRKLHESAFKLVRKLNKKPWVCNECGHSHTESGWCGFCRTQYLHRRRVLSLSLGDWLDHEVPVEWLARMLDTIRLCPHLEWLLCTKLPQLWRVRMDAVGNLLCERFNRKDEHSEAAANLLSWLNDWRTFKNPPRNVWIIASAEDQGRLEQRVVDLLKIPAVVHGISAEPLLGPIDFTVKCPPGYQPHLRFDRVNWVIAGGESGRNARPCQVEWVRSIKDQCAAAGVPCFVKQLGSRSVQDIKDARGHYIGFEGISHKHPKGADPAEWPEDLRIRQYPEANR